MSSNWSSSLAPKVEEPFSGAAIELTESAGTPFFAFGAVLQRFGAKVSGWLPSYQSRTHHVDRGAGAAYFSFPHRPFRPLTQPLVMRPGHSAAFSYFDRHNPFMRSIRLTHPWGRTQALQPDSLSTSEPNTPIDVSSERQLQPAAPKEQFDYQAWMAKYMPFYLQARGLYPIVYHFVPPRLPSPYPMMRFRDPMVERAIIMVNPPRLSSQLNKFDLNSELVRGATSLEVPSFAQSLEKFSVNGIGDQIQLNGDVNSWLSDYMNKTASLSTFAMARLTRLIINPAKQSGARWEPSKFYTVNGDSISFRVGKTPIPNMFFKQSENAKLTAQDTLGGLDLNNLDIVDFIQSARVITAEVPSETQTYTSMLVSYRNRKIMVNLERANNQVELSYTEKLFGDQPANDSVSFTLPDLAFDGLWMMSDSDELPLLSDLSDELLADLSPVIDGADKLMDIGIDDAEYYGRNWKNQTVAPLVLTNESGLESPELPSDEQIDIHDVINNGFREALNFIDHDTGKPPLKMIAILSYKEKAFTLYLDRETRAASIVEGKFFRLKDFEKATPPKQALTLTEAQSEKIWSKEMEQELELNRLKAHQRAVMSMKEELAAQKQAKKKDPRFEFGRIAEWFRESAADATDPLLKELYQQAARINERANSPGIWQAYSFFCQQEGAISFAQKALRVNHIINTIYKDAITSCDKPRYDKQVEFAEKLRADLALGDKSEMREALHLSTVRVVEKTSAELAIDKALNESSTLANECELVHDSTLIL